MLDGRENLPGMLAGTNFRGQLCHHERFTPENALTVFLGGLAQGGASLRAQPGAEWIEELTGSWVSPNRGQGWQNRWRSGKKERPFHGIGRMELVAAESG